MRVLVRRWPVPEPEEVYRRVDQTMLANSYSLAPKDVVEYPEVPGCDFLERWYYRQQDDELARLIIDFDDPACDEGMIRVEPGMNLVDVLEKIEHPEPRLRKPTITVSKGKRTAGKPDFTKPIGIEDYGLLGELVR